jgi:hypothetical protein
LMIALETRRRKAAENINLQWDYALKPQGNCKKKYWFNNASLIRFSEWNTKIPLKFDQSPKRPRMSCFPKCTNITSSHNLKEEDEHDS